MAKKFDINQKVWILRNQEAVSGKIEMEDPDWTEHYFITFDSDGEQDLFPTSRIHATKKELVELAVDALTQSFLGVKEDKERKLSDFEDAVVSCSKAEAQLNTWKKLLRDTINDHE